ncbi:MAG TPA: WXG100 family type VII secretion target [Actinoallomurus sp.]|jgi:WXG100 family type VII secretion target
MAGESAVDRAAMGQAAQEVEEKANIVKGLQNTLESHKSDLMAGWKGVAAMSFNQVHEEFNKDFAQVINALQGMHESLVHTKINYEKKEQESQEAASEVQRLLGG